MQLVLVRAVPITAAAHSGLQPHLKDLNGLTVPNLLDKLDALGDLERTDNPVPEAPGSFCFLIDHDWWKLTIPPDPLFVKDPIKSLDVSILERLVLHPIFGIEDVRTDSRIDFVGGIRGTAELEKTMHRR